MPIPGKKRLIAMIADATVDAYDESEQRMGFYSMLEEHLDTPFETTVLDTNAVVERIDVTDDDQIIAICRNGRSKQAIPILELRLPTPHPAGTEWIEAYRLWSKSR